ncbi:helix-turn-helix domain-containing protein [Streptomyces bambusae]|uniref:helix-turn-helix domain-containing protein n=1 Tax=Streptomyces bambusae TaxID=1550616 RepID=UPI001D000C73|nr:helix-turn-helix transcriptional regulator [Streptomyces bambusae]MCB5170135.1 helix-turn-helix domain-containing protein [Streptomyces bambusae]
MGSNPDLGAIFRSARHALRLKQEDVARAVGYSRSAISRIEGNRMRVDLDTRLRLAQVLRIPPEQVAGFPLSAAPVIDTVGALPMPDKEDAMRRRNLLGALAAGASAIALPGTAEARPAPVSFDDMLFRLPSTDPAPLRALASQAAAARTAFTAARYSDLGRALPGLLSAAEATRDAAVGRARQQANAILARAYVLACELAAKQHSDTAWVAADRALAAARASGMPIPVGEAARVLAITMRRSGNCSSAVSFLTTETAALDPAEERTAAVRTTLLLTAAYSAAAGGDRATALSLLDEADETVERWPQAPGGLFTVEATKTQAAVYRIGVHTTLGTPDEAVEIARGLNIDLMPTAERRARAWTDTARMWHALGHGQQAFTALRHVEQEAAQEVRRPALRALTSNLLYGPTRVEGLREFAVRTGAAPA